MQKKNNLPTTTDYKQIIIDRLYEDNLINHKLYTKCTPFNPSDYQIENIGQTGSLFEGGDDRL